MKRKKLQFNIYKGKVGVLTNISVEKRLLQAMGWSFAALAVLYIFILGNTVSNIVERRSHEAKIKNLATEVAELELHFLSLSRKIDLDYGRSLGFIESKEEHFATKKSLGSVSLQSSEL